MPRIKLNILGSMKPWTKVPNHLIDELLPTLKDTELRLLLVLLRQTVGWNRPERPVVLPYKALMHRTGRASEAISAALKSLHARRLIHTSRPKTPLKFRIPKAGGSESEAQQ